MRRMKQVLLPSVAFFCLLLIDASVFAADRTVGVIMTGNIPYYREVHSAFVDELNQAPGKTEVIVQTPSPEPMAWTNAARKLVTVGADVIVSYGAPATQAALHEAGDIPVVFAAVYDPEGVGIRSRNSTGVSSKVPVAGLLKSLRGIAAFSKLGVVFSDAEKDTVLQADEIKRLEGTFGFQSVRFNIKRAEDAAAISNVNALILTTGCAAMRCVSNIVGVARKGKLLTAATIGGGEASGVILTLAATPQEQGREAARLAARILKGEKPSSLPVIQPRRVDMTVNLKEAGDMGYRVPIDILTSATKVIK